MKHKAPLFGVLAAVLIGAAFWYLLYQPKSEELAVVQSEVAQLQAQQATLRNEISQLEAIQADELIILAELARLEEFIPTGTAQPAVVRQFQESADAAGVQITSVNFGQATPIEGAPTTGDPDMALAEIPVTMVVEGGYFQAVDFLRRLEVDVPRAVLMESVNIAEGEKKFPSLASTWGGRLFTVVPVVPAPAPEPNATESEGDGSGTPTPEETAGENTAAEESQS